MIVFVLNNDFILSVRLIINNYNYINMSYNKSDLNKKKNDDVEDIALQ